MDLQVDVRNDVQGMPNREAVTIYAGRTSLSNRFTGLYRIYLTPLEAHRLAEQLTLYSRAASGRFQRVNRKTDDDKKAH